MKPLLLISLLFTFFFAHAQETREKKNGTIHIKKPRPEIFVTTVSKYDFKRVERGTVLRLSGRNYNFRNLSELPLTYTMPAPVADSANHDVFPFIGAGPDGGFDFTGFFKKHLDYNCPTADSSGIDSVTITIVINRTGDFSYKLVKYRSGNVVLVPGPCAVDLSTGAMRAIRKIKKWSRPSAKSGKRRVKIDCVILQVKVWVAPGSFEKAQAGAGRTFKF